MLLWLLSNTTASRPRNTIVEAIMYQDDLEYASRRLNNTLVRLSSGEPFFVLRTYYDDKGRMYHDGEDLIIGDRKSVPHDFLNLEPVPLGFVNVTNDMVYVARKPMRRDWRQGLSHNSIVTYGRLRPEEINMKMLTQPIVMSYPTFNKALSSMGKRSSMAFSRDFGLSKHPDGMKIIYRKHVVGEVVDGSPCLLPSTSFLQQHLQEAIK